MNPRRQHYFLLMIILSESQLLWSAAVGVFWTNSILILCWGAGHPSRNVQRLCFFYSCLFLVTLPYYNVIYNLFMISFIKSSWKNRDFSRKSQSLRKSKESSKPIQRRRKIQKYSMLVLMSICMQVIKVLLSLNLCALKQVFIKFSAF